MHTAGQTDFHTSLWGAGMSQLCNNDGVTLAHEVLGTLALYDRCLFHFYFIFVRSECSCSMSMTCFAKQNPQMTYKCKVNASNIDFQS